MKEFLIHLNPNLSYRLVFNMSHLAMIKID